LVNAHMVVCHYPLHLRLTLLPEELFIRLALHTLFLAFLFLII
jgi:hypothetical protein